MDKVVTSALKYLSREREELESRASSRAEIENTVDMQQTFELVAAISYGKGLRSQQQQPVMPPVSRAPQQQGRKEGRGQSDSRKLFLQNVYLLPFFSICFHNFDDFLFIHLCNRVCSTSFHYHLYKSYIRTRILKRRNVLDSIPFVAPSITLPFSPPLCLAPAPGAAHEQGAQHPQDQHQDGLASASVPAIKNKRRTSISQLFFLMIPDDYIKVS